MLILKTRILTISSSFGLGKDGIHSLTAWGADIRVALEHKVGQITSTPGNVDLGRRFTVFGGETVPDAIPNLYVVQEEDGGATGLGRSMSTRSLGLRAEVPHNVDPAARSSFASTNVPPSAASTVTLFDEFVAELENEVQAQSTPHNSIATKVVSRQPAPPMPRQTRRSSILYIRSDDPVSSNPVEPSTTITPPSTISTLAQWSTRAVRPLIPKASKLQRKTSKADAKSGSPGGNLRPLSLLQNRNLNSTDLGAGTETRPLSLGKARKSRTAAAPVQDENAYPDSSVSARSKHLKPLKLARSDTAKMRGQLRKNEILPDVVVRPPSTGDYSEVIHAY